MILSKWRMAAAVKRFPFVFRTIHALWRITRPHFSAGAIGVLVNPLGEILVVEHVYHAAPRWGLPGGYVDRGEDPMDTVVREMREELQMKVEVVRVLVVERCDGNHLDFAYLCQTRDPVGDLCEELLNYRWARPDDLPEMRRFHRKAIDTALDLLDVNV